MQTYRKQAHPGRTLLALVVGAAAILGALGIAAVAAPGAAPVILLAAFLVDAIGAVVLYIWMRRRHW